jgi:hypothetical protein
MKRQWTFALLVSLFLLALGSSAADSTEEKVDFRKAL